jgi:hypothetical protein
MISDYATTPTSVVIFMASVITGMVKITLFMAFKCFLLGLFWFSKLLRSWLPDKGFHNPDGSDSLCDGIQCVQLFCWF